MNGLPLGGPWGHFAVAVAAAAAVDTLGPSPASACSCMAPPPPAEALAESDHVFEGRVTAIDQTDAGAAADPRGDGDLAGGGAPPPPPLPGALTVTFEVVRTWKGADAEKFSVVTAGNTAACGFPFEEGETYLVYATAGDHDEDGADDDVEGPLPGTGLCSRTKAIPDAGEDLAALGAGVVPVDVSGERESDGTESTSDDPGDPVDAPAAGAPKGQGGCRSCQVHPGGGLRAPALGFGMLLGWCLRPRGRGRRPRR